MFMPYSKNSELPRNIKSILPAGAQTIFRKAFNSAHEQYKEEVRAFKIAWSAVKKVYRKSLNGRWVKR